MDTRFWGPPGWRLLHAITFAYHPRDKEIFRSFFETLPFVLPCKYCRKSLTEYMEKDPLEPALKSQEALTRWLWRIHNEVNAKLRSQNLSTAPDPPFEKVRVFYRELLGTGCTQTEFPGWDFLFSVADLHPYSKAAKGSVPFEDAPPCNTIKDPLQRNRWNCMRPAERLPYYTQFWKAAGLVLPFEQWRTAWKRHAGSAVAPLKTREGTMKWLYTLRCGMEHDLQLLNRCQYSSLCKTLQTHRSGCSSSRNGKTCRRMKKSPRRKASKKTRRQKQRR